jgi:membrane protease YdiL (CAAX protease family)
MSSLGESRPRGDQLRFSWRVALVLVILIPLATLAVLPYSLTMQGGLPAESQLPMPLWLIITLQIGTQALMYGAVAIVGLFLASRSGLGAPILTGLLHGEPVGDRVRGMLLPSIALGVASGIIVIAADAVLFGPLLAEEMNRLGIDIPASQLMPPAWQGFLASFYGGIVEEILLRLGLMTLIAWILKWFWHTPPPNPRPAAGAIWTANIIAAVLFGLGHLPATFALGLPPDLLVISRAIILNGVIGVTAGWLYWKHGIESAMVAHFSADIVLHVLTPLVLGA